MSDAGSDARARRRAQEEFARPLVLEAGAGTGKTAALTARLVAWALGPGWVRAAGRLPGAAAEEVAVATHKGVVAITFTEAAAAEMAERVAETLAAVAAGSPPAWLRLPEGVTTDEVASRAAHLSSALDHLNVATIHAYCLAVLREESLAAGVHPGFEVDADGGAVREAIRAELAAWLPVAASSPAMAQLVAAGRSLTQVGEAVAHLVMAGVQPAELSLAHASSRWRQELRSLHRALSELEDAGGSLANVPRRSTVTHATWTAVVLTRQFLSATGDTDPVEVLAGLAPLWPDSCRQRLREWGEGTWTESERSALGDLAGEVEGHARQASEAVVSLLAARPEELAAAAEVLSTLLERVGERLKRSGVVTFQGLLVGAERLLASHPAVAARERSRLDQVLVDEFQDTDQVQCGVVVHLCLEGGPGERPGLFVVGDPKQSIYAWRSADLAAYEGFVARVLEAGGEAHPLCVNFRSVPPILAEVERALEPVMRYQREVQPAFQRLLPSEARQRDTGFRRGRWAPVEYWDRPASGEEKGSVLAARAVAADVAALHREGVAWERVGILLRTTSELETYLQALREVGVPYVVARDRSYYRRREVIEAAALLRVLADPADQVAVLTWLRSPLVGVPDAALLPLWRVGLPRLLTDLRGPDDPALAGVDVMVRQAAAAVPAGVPGIERVRGWEMLLVHGVRRVAELRHWLEREPFPAWLERVRQATWLEAGEAARYLGRFRLANLDTLLQRLERWVEEAGGDRRAVLTALRRAMAEETGLEGGRAAREAVAGVQVMTIHGAKGLDFDHVFLVEIHRRSRVGGEDNLVVRVGSRLFLKLLGIPWPSWQEGARLRQAMGRAELLRTLYVAMTRARERLVLVGDWGVQRGGREDSHLGILRHRRPDLSWESAQEEDGWRWLDAAGVRWVIPPALAAARERGGCAPAAPAFDVARAAAQASRLRGLAADAQRRAARPRGGAVTAEAHRHEEEWRRSAGVPQVPAAVAAAAGTAVHAVLERLDLAAPVAPQLRKWAEDVEALLPSDRVEELGAVAAARAREILLTLADSSLSRHLDEVGPAVLGREVALLLPGEESGDGPLEYLAGAIDLLYREPTSGELVVADFKTDAVMGEEELQHAAAGYRRQGELYCRAVQQALELPALPHFELWFLHPGRVVRLW